MNEALLIIDMQKYFYDLNPEIFDQKIIPNLLKKMESCRENKTEIFHIRTVYSRNKSDWPESKKSESEIWCMEGAGGEEYINGFLPQNNEVEIIKTRYSAFYHTNLNDHLVKENIERIFLCGFSSDVCLRATAFDAFNEGFQIFLLTDCMHSMKEDFEKTISYLEWVVKAKRI